MVWKVSVLTGLLMNSAMVIAPFTPLPWLTVTVTLRSLPTRLKTILPVRASEVLASIFTATSCLALPPLPLEGLTLIQSSVSTAQSWEAVKPMLRLSPEGRASMVNLSTEMSVGVESGLLLPQESISIMADTKRINRVILCISLLVVITRKDTNFQGQKKLRRHRSNPQRRRNYSRINLFDHGCSS